MDNWKSKGPLRQDPARSPPPQNGGWRTFRQQYWEDGNLTATHSAPLKRARKPARPKKPGPQLPLESAPIL